jgi:regulator of RNase E activity RraA
MTLQTIDSLREFDTPTICNAIEMFEVRPRDRGYGRGGVKAAFPEMAPIVGVACTAAFRADVPPAGDDPYGPVEMLLDLVGGLDLPGIVVCEDREDPPVGAIFGEVMCSLYKSLGAVGLITSGAGRDFEQLRSLDFAVFAGSTCASHAYCHAIEAGKRVMVDGAEIENGELIHADRNGFTTIPAEVVDELADVAKEYVVCEAVVMEACRSGPQSRQELKAARREMIRRLQELRLRASRRRSSH